MEIHGKTALVTGGAKRVGRAIALALAGKGAQLLLHYRGSEKEARETASEIKTLGGQCELLQADLSKTSDIQKMISEIDKRSSSVDILVNSASLYFKTPVESVREEEWDKLLAANLKAPFLLSVEIGRRMSKRSGGKIVNIADWSGFRPYKDFIAYCTSK